GRDRDRRRRRTRARSHRDLVPNSARTGSRPTPARGRLETAPAPRTVRTTAVAGSDAVRVVLGERAFHLERVLDRRRPRVLRVPADRARASHAAVADRAPEIRRGGSLAAPAVSRRQGCPGERG